MSSNTPTPSASITTVAQYAAIAAVGYGIYYTRQKANARQNQQPARAAADTTEQRNEKSAKKQRVEQYAQEATSQKQPSKAQPKTSQSPKQDVAIEDDTDDQLNNKEFAKQLASLKEGKKFTATGNEKKKKKQKSVKQSQAQVHEPAKVSPPSSTGGIDADDDQSPPVSPQVIAADASGVEDMLETPAPGPGSMRIVASETSQPQKAKSQKQAEAPLSKKQKQRRRKAEANKAAADEAEKDRKALMEKQRRLARVSEGRAAKDGSQFMASVNGKNAWKAGQPNGAAAAKPSTEATPAPLDTFEKSTPAPASKKSEAWMSSVPSEEEQMELLKSKTEDDEWNTVTTKKPKKISTPTEEKAEPVAPQTAQPKAKAPKGANGKPSGSNGFNILPTEEPEEDEEEIEWDV